MALFDVPKFFELPSERASRAARDTAPLIQQFGAAFRQAQSQKFEEAENALDRAAREKEAADAAAAADRRAQLQIDALAATRAASVKESEALMEENAARARDLPKVIDFAQRIARDPNAAFPDLESNASLDQVIGIKREASKRGLARRISVTRSQAEDLVTVLPPGLQGQAIKMIPDNGIPDQAFYDFVEQNRERLPVFHAQAEGRMTDRQRAEFRMLIDERRRLEPSGDERLIEEGTKEGAERQKRIAEIEARMDAFLKGEGGETLGEEDVFDIINGDLIQVK